MIDSYTIQLLVPEATLVTAAVVVFMAGAFASGRTIPAAISLLGLLLTAIVLYRQDMNLGVLAGAEVEGSGPLIVDVFGHTARWGVVLLGFLFVVLSSGRSAVDQSAEYLGSLLVILAGLMIVATTSELVLMFLGLEMISIPTYVLLYLGRRGAAGQESTVKYFFLSILSSAILLYGFSFLYGSAGSTSLADLQTVLSRAAGSETGLISATGLGLLLVFAGLGFRITAVPFHFYAPDVYQGTSHTNAGLLSTLPKIAGLLALVRIAAACMPEMQHLGWKLSIMLAALTMTLGNVVALWQDNLRRMLAYSSIAHGGYMLIGLAVAFATAGAADQPTLDGIGTVIFYMLVYALATIGTFAALSYLSRRGQPIDEIDELAGLNQTHVVTALAIAVFMFSLTGIPPLAGFWGKFALFMAALDVDAGGSLGGELRPWFVGLAVLAVLNAAISAAYYLRVVAAMYFRPAVGELRAEGGMGAYAVMLLCALATIGAGLRAGPLLQGSDMAGRSAMVPPESSLTDAADMVPLRSASVAGADRQ